MLEIVRELVDAVHSLKGITDNRRAELHTQLDEAETDLGTRAEPAPAAAKADVPAGA